MESKTGYLLTGFDASMKPSHRDMESIKHWFFRALIQVNRQKWPLTGAVRWAHHYRSPQR
jgi:hypothetical protein